MLSSHFDVLVNSIYDYLYNAKKTSEEIRDVLSNIPPEIKKQPILADKLSRYISFISGTDLKFSVLKAKAYTLLSTLERSFDDELQVYCLGENEIYAIKRFCKSVSELICDEIRPLPICIESYFACIKLSEAAEGCNDAQARLCCALSEVFCSLHGISLPEGTLLRFPFTRNQIYEALLSFSDNCFSARYTEKLPDIQKYEYSRLSYSGLSSDNSAFEYTSESVLCLLEKVSCETENYGYFSDTANALHRRFSFMKTPAAEKPESVPSANVKGKRNKQTERQYNAPATDEVSFSAIAPARFYPGTSLNVEIFMYTDKFRSVVDNAIKSYTSNSVEKTRGYSSAEKHSKIRVELSCKEFEFDDNTLELTWIGKHLDFDFFVDVPKTFTGDTINFSAKVFINSMLATRLCFTVASEGSGIQLREVKRNDVRSIFISYASQDRYTVATMVYAFKLLMPSAEIIFDVNSLRSGEQWEERIEHHVKECDTLYLFWSEYAKESVWVDKEWRCALKTHGIESIIPVPLVHPDNCPPPEELNRMNFRDSMIFMLDSLKTMSAYKDPRLYLVGSETTRYMDANEILIGADKQSSHIIIDDKPLTGIFSKIVRDGNNCYIQKTNEHTCIKVNDTELSSDELIPLKNEDRINVEGKEMIFYASLVPSKSTKTA